MRVENYTDHHHKTLTEQMAAARAAVQAQTERAHELAKDLPPIGDPSPGMVLWNKAGYYAGIACLWFAFVAPILLVLENWD